jgi:hypothetical protein
VAVAVAAAVAAVTAAVTAARQTAELPSRTTGGLRLRLTTKVEILLHQGGTRA